MAPMGTKGRGSGRGHGGPWAGVRRGATGRAQGRGSGGEPWGGPRGGGQAACGRSPRVGRVPRGGWGAGGVPMMRHPDAATHRGAANQKLSPHPFESTHHTHAHAHARPPPHTHTRSTRTHTRMCTRTHRPIKHLTCFKLDALTVLEALVHTILILEVFSAHLNHSHFVLGGSGQSLLLLLPRGVVSGPSVHNHPACTTKCSKHDKMRLGGTSPLLLPRRVIW